MNTINDKELSRRIKGYLAHHRCEKPFVITGKPGIGKESIFKKTISSLGIESIQFRAVMTIQCGGECMVPFVRCENDVQWFFDYRLASDFVARTGRPVVMIVNEDDISQNDPDLEKCCVKYELTLEDWLEWGEENVGAAGKPKSRINSRVMSFLKLFPKFFMTEDGCSAREWKKISDRWSHVDSIVASWKLSPDNEEMLKLYSDAILEFCDPSICDGVYEAVLDFLNSDVNNNNI